MEVQQVISENDVKRITLGCLKTYYKYRPRGEGPTTARLDVRAARGIIADGYLTFEGFDGNPFVATFEATSSGTREEVWFRIQPRLLFWDSVVVGLIITALVLSLNFELNAYPVGRIGWLLTLGGSYLCFLIGYLTYHFLFSKLPRYRYIYAIEQFKKYHANEQWIAIASDVFAHANDPKLKELKSQCIRNGFGLIKIEQDLEPYLLITPARREVFKGKRRQLNFLDLDNWTEKIRNQVKLNWWNFAGERFEFLRPRESVMRFQRTYYKQYLLSALALVLIGLIFREEYRSARISYVDEEEFAESMLVPGDAGYSSETTVYLIDTIFLDQFKSSASHNLEVAPAVEAIQPEPELPDDPPEEEPAIIAQADGNPIYDCARIYNLDSVHYILVLATYEDSERAIIELSKLQGLEIDANLLWLGCFNREMTDFAVYLGLIYPDAQEAKDRKTFFIQAFADAGLNPPSLQIRTIVKR